MIKIKAKVDFNIQEAIKELEGVSKDSVKELSSMILNDCNEYVKEDSGKLIESSYKASDLTKGDIVWDTPYARRQYYTGEPNKSKNNKASKFWIHKAYAVNKNKWLKKMQSLIGGE